MPLFRRHAEPVATTADTERSLPPSSTTPPPATTTNGSSSRRSRSMFARRRSSSSSAGSIHSDGHDRTDGTHTRSRSRRKGLFGMGGQRKSDPVLDNDPHILAARDKLAAAERAEQEADRALEFSRRAVIEARDHCKQLQAQAIEDARRAKAKRSEARGLGKQARGLGRHN
ncbi:unnamed protein product [Rhizoctonia solani]|uniref:Uncharacterized protein n=1 Tax=Rhizoctonia solani TaxID=456999 RepID=A0A8H3AXF6_9AGAM|nr:unnamed protein product [Rhizoctonia solani]